MTKRTRTVGTLGIHQMKKQPERPVRSLCWLLLILICWLLFRKKERRSGKNGHRSRYVPSSLMELLQTGMLGARGRLALAVTIFRGMYKSAMLALFDLCDVRFIRRAGMNKQVLSAGMNNVTRGGNFEYQVSYWGCSENLWAGIFTNASPGRKQRKPAIHGKGDFRKNRSGLTLSDL